MSATTRSLTYAEWIALSILYQHRDRPSSPAHYVGLTATIKLLLEHQPPLAKWVGNRRDKQLRITTEGIARFEEQHES